MRKKFTLINAECIKMLYLIILDYFIYSAQLRRSRWDFTFKSVYLLLITHFSLFFLYKTILFQLRALCIWKSNINNLLDDTLFISIWRLFEEEYEFIEVYLYYYKISHGNFRNFFKRKTGNSLDMPLVCYNQNWAQTLKFK